MLISEKLAELRAVVDERERIAAEEKRLGERKRQLEKELADFAKTTGVDKFSGAGMSVAFAEKMRARYEPNKWHDIASWAVSTGNDHIIQRRLTDAKVLELVDSGVALPDGLTLEAYTDISLRRI